jgi:DNA processing protein
MAEVCDRCTRRSWLVGRLAGNLEQIRGNRPAVRGVLALSDRKLIAALGGRDKSKITAQWSGLDTSRQRREWRSASTSAICRHNSNFPQSLADLPDPPAVLHIYGDPARLDELLAPSPAVALVGARRASADGLELARELGRTLSLCGVTVVSGMALGIDSAAHEGALAGGARTVAVLACGPERAYPARRKRLHSELAERGVVISELPPGTPPFRWAFPARNRIIAALARITVVVEAAERSGSLITAEIAADLGRSVGAVPGHPGSWHSCGANALLRDGAHLIRDARDILDDALGVEAAPGAIRSREPLPLPPGLSDHQSAVVAAVDAGFTTVASVAEYCGAAAEVVGPLTELELLGVIERRADGGYRRL